MEENQYQIAVTIWEMVAVAGSAIFIIVTGAILPFVKSQSNLASWKKGVEKDILSLKERIDQDEKTAEKDITALKERMKSEDDGQKNHNKNFYDLINKLTTDHSEMKAKLAEIAVLLNTISEAVKRK